MRLFTGIAAAAATFVLGSASVFADQPGAWQMNLPVGVTPVMESVVNFHNYLLWLIAAISLFVLVLLVFALVRFSAGAHPEPSRTTHNSVVEIAWTVVPILILIAIAIPSFRLLYLQRDYPKADFTIKAIGNQWFWTYEYPDHGDIVFDSLLKHEDELEPGEPYLLAVDAPVVVRQGPCLHAHRGAGGVAGRVRRVGQDGVGARRRPRQPDAERTAARPRPSGCC